MHLLSTMHKHEHWQQSLGAFLEAGKNTPFEWGSQDCCTFAANCVDAQYNTEILKNEIFSEYKDKSSAIELVRKYGSLGAIIDTFMERIERPVRGSIVVFQTDNGDTTGVYLNRKVWSQGPDGIVWFNADEVEINTAWGAPKCHQQ